MKKIIYTVLFAIVLLFAADDDDVVNIAKINFQDMYWANDDSTTYEDVLYSRQKLADHTADKKAIILYFFDLHLC